MTSILIPLVLVKLIFSDFYYYRSADGTSAVLLSVLISLLRKNKREREKPFEAAKC